MKNSLRSRRGQPLMVYTMLLVGWTALRAVLWDSPLPDRVAPELATSRPAAVEATSKNDPYSSIPRLQHPLEGGHANRSTNPEWTLAPPLAPPIVPVDRAPLEPIAPYGDQAGPNAADEGEFAADNRTAAGHQLLWLAAMAQLPVPRPVAEAADRQSQSAQPSSWLPLAKARNQRRWSLDAWVFLRENSGGALVDAGLRPSYGKSQQGAVVRYRLAEAGGRQPALYTRITRALGDRRETELAAGLTIKPFAELPVQAHAEMRATRIAGRTELRPSAFVTAGLHRELADGVQLRGYGQAGYVGGEFATAFVDGQLVADREVAAFDLGKVGDGSVRLGAGAWGGAQKGSERLDVGPSANVVVPVADAPVRLSVDYRFRVAGDAEPDTGLALTLATGF